MYTLCSKCGAYWLCDHKRRAQEIREKLEQMLRPVKVSTEGIEYR